MAPNRQKKPVWPVADVVLNESRCVCGRDTTSTTPLKCRWPMVRKGKESFEKFMDLTVKGMSRLENRSKSPTPLTGRANHAVPSSLALVLDTVTHNEGPMDQPTQFSAAAQSTNTFDPVCMSQVVRSAPHGVGYIILMNKRYTFLTLYLKTASIILSCSVMGPLTVLNFQPLTL